MEMWIGQFLFLAMVWFLAWRGDYFQRPTYFASLKPSGRDVLTVFVVYLFVQIFVATSLVQVVYALKGQTDPHLFSQPPALAWVLIAAAILGAVFVLPFSWRAGELAPQIWSWGPQPRFAVARHLSIGILTWVIAFPLVALINQGLEAVTTSFTDQLPKEQVAVTVVRGATTGQMVLVLIAVAILIPMIEEILFRGFLQSYLKKYMRPLLAVILSATLFSLVHFSRSQSWNNVEIVTALFVLGLFLGYLYERQRSLWAPIGLHIGFNTISLIYILFAPET